MTTTATESTTAQREPGGDQAAPAADTNTTNDTTGTTDAPAEAPLVTQLKELFDPQHTYWQSATVAEVVDEFANDLAREIGGAAYARFSSALAAHKIYRAAWATPAGMWQLATAQHGTINHLIVKGPKVEICNDYTTAQALELLRLVGAIS